MEERVPVFRQQEQEGRIADLSDSLVAITGCVARVRRAYQPGFPLPTYSEIRRVVQEEWNADMERIDPDRVNPSAEQMRQEVKSENEENASEARWEGEQG